MNEKINASGQSCLCDFTYDFFWQHKGSRLDPESAVSGVSYRQMVDTLKRGCDIGIIGTVGNRLASSMGVDIMRFGGSGGPLQVGSIVVDGDVGNRMGISMLRGSIYVSGKVGLPLGNVIEVPTDKSGYSKFKSITDVLENNIPVLSPNYWDGDVLNIVDGLQRETVGARNPANKEIHLEGDAGMSAGILMGSGTLRIDGDSGRNTGVLLNGGSIIVCGSADDFTAFEMRSGKIIIEGKAGSFICSRMRGGFVYAKDGKPVPPASIHNVTPDEQRMIANTFEISPMYAMMYKRFGL